MKKSYLIPLSAAAILTATFFYVKQQRANKERIATTLQTQKPWKDFQNTGDFQKFVRDSYKTPQEQASEILNNVKGIDPFIVESLKQIVSLPNISEFYADSNKSPEQQINDIIRTYYNYSKATNDYESLSDIMDALKKDPKAISLLSTMRHINASTNTIRPHIMNKITGHVDPALIVSQFFLGNVLLQLHHTGITVQSQEGLTQAIQRRLRTTFPSKFSDEMLKNNDKLRDTFDDLIMILASFLEIENQDLLGGRNNNDESTTYNHTTTGGYFVVVGNPTLYPGDHLTLRFDKNVGFTSRVLEISHALFGGNDNDMDHTHWEVR